MNSPSNHIPQPPHSAGLSYQGLKPRIEPAQIPSPTETIEADRILWEDQAYGTYSGGHAPLATTDFIAIDQGNSSPKFVRVTTWNLPSTSRLASDCSIPLVAIFHPFAELDPLEEPVPVVDTGETGPARCERCRGYVNPWCRWIVGGAKWKCNLCGHETEVAPEYYCALDANLMRLDYLQRPELTKGTVDFIVPKDYWATNPPQGLNLPYSTVEPRAIGLREPQPLSYIFAIDVSRESVDSGFLRSACNVIHTILFGTTSEGGVITEPSFPSGCSTAIMTFDNSIHFYDLSTDTLPMIINADIEEAFIPARRGLFEKPSEHREAIETLLDAIPTRFDQTLVSQAALGTLLRTAHAALAGRGGQVIVFQSTKPTIGIGSLQGQLNETELYDTDKEKTLYVPRDRSWGEIGEDCAADGIGINLVLAPSKYIDVGSIGATASLTGGDIFFHPRFDPTRDEPVVLSQLRRLIVRQHGYNCAMRIRSSNGISISKTHYGNFCQSSPTTLEFGVLDADKAISIIMEHTGSSLSSRDMVHLQASVLYTTVEGQRRARICNIALPVVELAANVFQYADLDATLCHMAREAMVSRTTKKMNNLREDLTKSCATLLLGYRRNCAAATRTTQLILPEAYKALPSYTLSLIKSKPLKGLVVSSDVRNYHAHRISSMSVRSLLTYLYPRLIAIHDLEDTIALPDETGRIRFPTSMRDSHLFMESHGIYLIDNGELTIIWVGASTSPQLIQDLFGVDDIMTLDPHIRYLPHLDTRLSIQVRNIIAYHTTQCGGRLTKFHVARQNLDAAELEFSDMLVEDQNNGNMSYVDYLTLVHRQISDALKHGGSISSSTSMRGSPW